MNDDTKSQLHRSVIDYGRDTLKATMIINGAAAAVTLAFIGNIWSDTEQIKLIKGFLDSVILFGYGVASAGFAYFFGLVYYTIEHNDYGKIVSRFASFMNLSFYMIWLLTIGLSLWFFFSGVQDFYRVVTAHFS